MEATSLSQTATIAQPVRPQTRRRVPQREDDFPSFYDENDMAQDAELQVFFLENVYAAVTEAVRRQEKKAILCEQHGPGLRRQLYIDRSEWTTALKKSEAHYARVEDFEHCSEITTLIKQLNGRK